MDGKGGGIPIEAQMVLQTLSLSKRDVSTCLALLRTLFLLPPPNVVHCQQVIVQGCVVTRGRQRRVKVEQPHLDNVARTLFVANVTVTQVGARSLHSVHPLSALSGRLTEQRCVTHLDFSLRDVHLCSWCCRTDM